MPRWPCERCLLCTAVRPPRVAGSTASSCSRAPTEPSFFSRPQPPPTGVGAAGGGASASQLAAALERVSALERQNAELRDAAASKDAVLAESRCVKSQNNTSCCILCVCVHTWRGPGAAHRLAAVSHQACLRVAPVLAGRLHGQGWAGAGRWVSCDAGEGGWHGRRCWTGAADRSPPPPPSLCPPVPASRPCSKFIQGYLSRSSAAAEQRQSTLRGPAPAGGAPAAADGPQAAAPAAPQAEHATAEGASV